MYGSSVLRRCFTALLLLSAAATTFAAGPHHYKLSPDVSSAKGEGISVIIQYKDRLADSDVDKITGLGGKEARAFTRSFPQGPWSA